MHVGGSAHDDAVVARVVHQDGRNTTRAVARREHVRDVDAVTLEVLNRVLADAVVADFRHHRRPHAQHRSLHALIGALSHPRHGIRSSSEARHALVGRHAHVRACGEPYEAGSDRQAETERQRRKCGTREHAATTATHPAQSQPWHHATPHLASEPRLKMVPEHRLAHSGQPWRVRRHVHDIGSHHHHLRRRAGRGRAQAATVAPRRDPKRARHACSNVRREKHAVRCAVAVELGNPAKAARCWQANAVQ